MRQKELYEEHERRMHDVKHVLLFLQQCIEENECDRALQKLSSYQDTMQGKQRVIELAEKLDDEIEFYYDARPFEIKNFFRERFEKTCHLSEIKA